MAYGLVYRPYACQSVLLIGHTRFKSAHGRARIQQQQQHLWLKVCRIKRWVAASTIRSLEWHLASGMVRDFDSCLPRAVLQPVARTGLLVCSHLPATGVTTSFSFAKRLPISVRASKTIFSFRKPAHILQSFDSLST